LTGEPAFSRVVPLGGTEAAAIVGAKAAGLSAALRAGLPVLPGWVVPCEQARAATFAAASMVRRGAPAAARRAALSLPLDSVLATELAEAAVSLGGRVIVRSSSPLESDPRWSGAFSSIAEIGAAEIATAVRSCWAAAFAVDPLARLESCGLAPEALELAVIIQAELRPDAGGIARVAVAASNAGGADSRGRDAVVQVEGVAGHPGPLLAGWADGVSAWLRMPARPTATPENMGTGSLGPVPPTAGSELAELIGSRLAYSVAELAARVYRSLGDDTIEWAIQDGKVWLLQSQASGMAAVTRGPDARSAEAADDQAEVRALESDGFVAAASSAAVPDCADSLRECLAAREWMPQLAAAIRARGQRLPARPASAGTAAGRLVACRPHERLAESGLDAILLVDRPVPALAPLLFGARGLIARSGGAGAHLAAVARSLAVPMVTGCQLPAGIGDDLAGMPGVPWLAAIDGTTGEVALLAR
jgi:phosphohistidine swiveling domain-containing protein